MQFGVIKDFNGGPESGPFKIAKLTIVTLHAIGDPGISGFSQVDIIGLVGQSVLFKSDDDLKTSIASTFDIPVANVELRDVIIPL
jgi:hypothetical protein